MEELPWYRIFANTIKDTYIDYVKNQFGRRVSHLNRHNIHLFAWTSVWTEGIYHKYHSHQDSIVSGTYYPINEGGQGIKFQSPHIILHGFIQLNPKQENQIFQMHSVLDRG